MRQKLLKIIFLIALLHSFANAELVKIFDLSKIELSAKEKNKIETYDIGEQYLKTDLIYNAVQDNYYLGNKASFIFKEPLKSGMIVLKVSLKDSSKNNFFTFEDEHGGIFSIKVVYNGTGSGYGIRIGDKAYYLGSNNTLKILFENGKNIELFHEGIKIANFKYNINEIKYFNLFLDDDDVIHNIEIFSKE